MLACFGSGDGQAAKVSFSNPRDFLKQHLPDRFEDLLAKLSPESREQARVIMAGMWLVTREIIKGSVQDRGQEEDLFLNAVKSQDPSLWQVKEDQRQRCRSR